MQVDCAPESLTGFWIHLAARVLLRATDAELRPHGLTLSHLPVLRALGQGEALSQKALARAARVEQPTMTEMLTRMERDGFVQRRPDPNDGRGKLISLTRTARTRMKRATATLLATERRAMAGLSADEWTMLRVLLGRVVQNLEGEVP